MQSGTSARSRRVPTFTAGKLTALSIRKQHSPRSRSRLRLVASGDRWGMQSAIQWFPGDIAAVLLLPGELRDGAKTLIYDRFNTMKAALIGSSRA